MQGESGCLSVEVGAHAICGYEALIRASPNGRPAHGRNDQYRLDHENSDVSPGKITYPLPDIVHEHHAMGVSKGELALNARANQRQPVTASCIARVIKLKQGHPQRKLAIHIRRYLKNCSKRSTLNVSLFTLELLSNRARRRHPLRDELYRHRNLYLLVH
jgi:hypothetical protein